MVFGGDMELQSSMAKGREALHQISKLDHSAMSKLRKRYWIKKQRAAMFVDQRSIKMQRAIYELGSYHIRLFPDFWRTACLNKFRSRLTKEDIKVFTFLKTLEVKDVKDVEYGYSITFDFDVNPYFENSSLTKTFVFSHDGVASVTCTKIQWKEGKDITYQPKENIPVEEGKKWSYFLYSDESFFTWFSDQGLYCDQLDEAIKYDLWPGAVKYFLMEKEMAPDKEEEGETSLDRSRKARDLEQLKSIQQTLDERKHERFVERSILNELYHKKLKEKEMLLKHDLSSLRRAVYQSDTMKSIPNFWLNAFLSHHALGLLLSEQDQKIFKFLTCMDVEYIRTNDKITGYTITLNFDENPYFGKASLVKAFSFSPSGETYIRGPSINWKEGMDITTGPQHEIFIKKGDNRKVDYGTSFFTWFSDSENLSEHIREEVAELIIDDLWPNAFDYFLSEKEND